MQYPSVRGAKVVTDPNTGRSKGYGFVKFGDEMERNRAMTEMNGVYCSTRPMRISAATPKKTTAAGVQQQYPVAQGENLNLWDVDCHLNLWEVDCLDNDNDAYSKLLYFQNPFFFGFFVSRFH